MHDVPRTFFPTQLSTQTSQCFPLHISILSFRCGEHLLDLFHVHIFEENVEVDPDPDRDVGVQLPTYTNSYKFSLSLRSWRNPASRFQDS